MILSNSFLLRKIIKELGPSIISSGDLQHHGEMNCTGIRDVIETIIWKLEKIKREANPYKREDDLKDLIELLSI